MNYRLIEKSQFRINKMRKDTQFIIVDTRDIIYYKEGFGWKILNTRMLSEESWSRLVRFIIKHGAITDDVKFDLEVVLPKTDPNVRYFLDSLGEPRNPLKREIGML